MSSRGDLDGERVSSVGRLVGLDLGTKRIGVAVSDSAQSVATPLKFVARSGDRLGDHSHIASIVSEYEAVGVVVGLPVSLSGEMGPAAKAVLEEVADLRQVLGVAVDVIDERLTTKQAAGSLRRAGMSSRAQRTIIDDTAAALLLQSWIDRSKASS
jgi:putative Holliday junction resolvase